MIWETLLAFPQATLLAFLAGALVLNFTPGADVLFATACGVQGGPRAGAAAGLGVGLGGLVHVSAAAFGLGALVATHPATLDLVRWAGAGYLLWIALRSWRAAPAQLDKAQGAPRLRVAFRRGVITNVLNPKVILFMLAYLPQFTDPAIGPIWQQILILGCIFSVTGTLVTMGYGTAAGVLGARLSRRMHLLNRVAAVMFGGLALRLVIE